MYGIVSIKNIFLVFSSYIPIMFLFGSTKLRIVI